MRGAAHPLPGQETGISRYRCVIIGVPSTADLLTGVQFKDYFNYWYFVGRVFFISYAPSTGVWFIQVCRL